MFNPISISKTDNHVSKLRSNSQDFSRSFLRIAMSRGGIDYSKWDHIELSDDEDIEVHPNIDKASFIRWRQQDIRRKREERRERIQQLTRQPAINKELDVRMKLLTEDT